MLYDPSWVTEIATREYVLIVMAKGRFVGDGAKIVLELVIVVCATETGVIRGLH